MATVAIEITFTEEVLGSSPNTKEIYSEFIASKAPDAASVADEVEAVGADEVTEKGTTVFPRNDDGEPVIWDYQLKGFMKDACGALRRVPGTLSSKCKAYKKVIDGTIFVKERSVAFQLPEGGEVGICERPLRADTPQGARVALARSETVPAGTKIRFTLVVMNKSDWPLVQEWLDYGQFRGNCLELLNKSHDGMLQLFESDGETVMLINLEDVSHAEVVYG